MSEGLTELLQEATRIATGVIDSKKNEDHEDKTVISISDDPVVWCEQTFKAKYHKKQREVMYSIRDNRKTAVPAAHGVGKDFSVASFICWWICRHLYDDVMVMCTAPSNRQVQDILFEELRKLHYLGQLPGEVLTKQWKATTEKGFTKVAIGSAPKAGQARSTFQGSHSLHMLIVIDEANGVPDETYIAIEGMMTGVNSRLVAIGNPDFAEGEFYKASEDDDTQYNVIPISVYDTPSYSKEEGMESIIQHMPDPEYIDSIARRYGRESAIFRSKVEGLFTSGTAAGFYPLEWIMRARDYEGKTSGKIILSADIGGGNDPTVIMLRHGEIIRDITPPVISKEPDGKKIGECIAKVALNPSKYAEEAGNRQAINDETERGFSELAVSTYRKHVTEVHIDVLNIGAKPYGECVKVLKDFEDILVVGCNVQESATDPDSFINRKAELADIVREVLSDEEEFQLDIDPNDDLLLSDFRAIKMDASGRRRKVVSKKATAKEIHRSTDKYDTVALSFNVDTTPAIDLSVLYSQVIAANDGLERDSPHSW